MKTAPLELIQKVADRKLETTGVNVWNALKYRAYIQVIDLDGNVLQEVPRLDRVAGFRLTPRGKDLLSGSATALPFDKNDPPLNVRLWVSAFRRWCRNCPKGLHLTHSDGQLHVLAADGTGKVKDDEIHRLASVKVPWHGS
jgi:hypothetical protein